MSEHEAERTVELQASTVWLRESEASFRAVFDHAGIGIAVLDQEARIVRANATMQEMFGYPEGEACTMTLSALTHPDDVTSDSEAFQDVCAGRLDRYQTEKRYYHKDGHLLWGRLTVTSLQDAAGQPHYVLGMLEDITERKRAEEALQRQATALQRLNAELAQSNRELDAFVYMASHDLKEPLRGLHHFSQLLLEEHADRLTEDGVEKLRTLMRLTRRMESLLASLLHYAYLGRTELAVEEIDTQEVVEETVELLAARLHESKVDVRIPARLPSVQADRVHLGEIFNNLIVNAIKYNDKAEKWIEIGCEASGAGSARPPVFYVRDNGIGIAPQHHEAIFRIFRRLHGREEYGGGTGVGLTIVRKIVERHGGRIWLASQPGAGSTFYFTLATSSDRPATAAREWPHIG